MSSHDYDPKTPLLTDVSQYEVDFVIPRLGVDVPVGIDPFLLYKSRNPEYRNLHSLLVDVFNTGIAAVKRGALVEARRIFDFPEVPAVGLGYTRGSKRGSGIGTYLTDLIIETLAGSPGLKERGVRHVEEMQLLSAGVGADRVSDITANVLKSFLVEYTQRQCALWDIPVRSGIPLEHIYESESQSWSDAYLDLPVNPNDGSPILLVPRRLVRALPWINYDDFLRTEFKTYLKARRTLSAGSPSSRIRTGLSEEIEQAKPGVVTVTRQDITIVERYVQSRERDAANARPAFDYIDEDSCREAESLKAKLTAIQAGQSDAAAFQQLVLEILNYLFNPELIDGQPEVRTVDGTERRDIIFTNDSDESFWAFIRNEHSGIVVTFDAKNKNVLELSDVNQMATYLGDRLGTFGVIVTRGRPTESVQRKMFAVWNDNRKVILALSDQDVRDLLDLRCRNGSPTKWMQRHYRAFRTAVQ